MKKYSLMISFLLPMFLFGQQKKHWINKYWASGSISLLFGNEKKATAASIDIGRNFAHNFKVGAGYTFMQFDLVNKVNVLNIYVEKCMENENSALYFFVKAGIASPIKAKAQTNKISSYEYYKSNAGFNLQLGTGMRWKIKRHSFFINGGYNITKYSLSAKEYLRPVNPYNPFDEEPIIHRYIYNYGYIFANIGFTL